MSRYNESTEYSVKNEEGGKAFKISPELELYSQVVTGVLYSNFYKSESEILDTIRRTLKQVDPLFAAKLAVYAREEMYLRTIPLVLTVELARLGTFKGLRALTTRVIQRADEITELLAYFSLAEERKEIKKLNKLPNAMKKGIADAFHKFNSYQFAKYNRKRDIKLADALALTHPKPKDKEESTVFSDILSGNLEIPYTWEVELSKAGQDGRPKKDVWEHLIASGKVGYMALLRNLRNILDASVDEKAVNEIQKTIGDPQNVAKSKQLPFRFLSAYLAITEEELALDHFAVQKIATSLEEAVKASIKNTQFFEEHSRILVACDVSSSMFETVSPNSTVSRYSIGLLLGQLVQSRCSEVVTGFFGDTWKVVPLPKDNVLHNTIELMDREGEVGYSTNGHKVIEWLNETNTSVDKILIFTDCQLWNSDESDNTISKEWAKYHSSYPDAKLYLFDLDGSSTCPLDVMHDKNVRLISGWSDKIFDVLHSIENGGQALDLINKIEI